MDSGAGKKSRQGTVRASHLLVKHRYGAARSQGTLCMQTAVLARWHRQESPLPAAF